MQIRTRLFLGTAGLVVALMAAQWWIHERQMRAVEDAFARVATSVGEGLLESSFRFVSTAGGPAEHAREGSGGAGSESGGAPADGGSAGVEGDLHRRLEVMVVEEEVGPADPRSAATVVRRVPRPPTDGDDEVTWVWSTGAAAASGDAAAGDRASAHHRVELQVVADGMVADRFLVLRTAEGEVERIRIPGAPAVELRRRSVRSGLAVGIGLLLVGLVSSGVMAHRLVRPLSRLSERSEALGRGELGVRVDEDAGGEIGELQRAFNRMSGRLAELERERESWLRREHLAELGDVARGLAHTLRNPLNTLGLTVEELATAESADPGYVSTARSQIRRIDGWLRSFLALGAGGAAERTVEDLSELVHGAAMAIVQQGGSVEVEADTQALPVRVVPSAVRAAVTNLLENAVQASPSGDRVTVRVGRTGDHAEVRIGDRGPGLPDDVRRRMFEPHVTTRAGGSGMGLFLARQLLVVMHGGALELEDRDGGGTEAVVRLPLERQGESP